MKTFVAKEHEVSRKWFLVNAENRVLGRLASQISDPFDGESTSPSIHPTQIPGTLSWS